jgi:O-acetylhomoserine (thiol)-lyase
MTAQQSARTNIQTAVLHHNRLSVLEHGAVHAPLHSSVPYVHATTANLIAVFQQNIPGFTYARQSNPTNASLESQISLLEEADDTIVFATGMGAISAVFFAFLKQGDHIVCSRYIFGNTSSLLGTFEGFGVDVDFVDATSVESVELAIRPETRMVFVETIANPGTEVADLEGIGALCRDRGVLFVVDNSLSTPALIRPTSYGAGLVINSLTKGIGGHGQAMGGAVSDTGKFDWTEYQGINPLYRSGDPARWGATQIRRKGLRDGGASLRPDDATKLATGMETLHLRAERACSNALALARWLAARAEVSEVRYPGLETHPQHERAKRLFGAKFGQLLSFTLQPEIEPATFLDRLEKVAIATHLWDTRSLALPVAPTIYHEMGEEGRRLAGIDEGLIRVSVGLEHIDDVIIDFEQALDNIQSA